jgi:putative oxidoreductase
MNEFWGVWQTRVLSLLRFIAGFLMLWHGSQKLFNFPATPNGSAGDAFMIFAGVLEFGGGLLIAVGLFTRWAAFLLSGTMAVAYWLAHGTSEKGFLPILNGGELAVVYCFLFLYLFFAGGGVWSLDYLLQRDKKEDGQNLPVTA